VPLFGTLARYFGILPVAKPTGYECRVNVSCWFHLPRFHRTYAGVTKCEVAVTEPSKLLKPLSCHGKFGPPQISSPRNLFSGKFVPPKLFCTENMDPPDKIWTPMSLCQFEQTIIYTWSIHTKEVTHNKFEVVYSSITHKEQNKLLVTTMTIPMYVCVISASSSAVAHDGMWHHPPHPEHLSYIRHSAWTVNLDGFSLCCLHTKMTRCWVRMAILSLDSKHLIFSAPNHLDFLFFCWTNTSPSSKTNVAARFLTSLFLSFSNSQG